MPEDVKTWNDRWNDVIRTVIFPDEELREQMMLSDDVTIMDFVTDKFVRGEIADEQVTNQDVRIVYYDSKGFDMYVEKVRGRRIEFDIYVKDKHLRDANNDRLKLRTYMIARRLRKQLTKNRYTCGIRFVCEDDYDLGTKTVGYSRYRISFTYTKTYV